MASDTARQIADLRAQGEFEKADALLALSQQYLSQLMSLEQWSMEFGLSVAQFNESLRQWQAEFAMAAADLTGYYNGMPTLKYQQYQNELGLTQQKQLASAGETLLAAGIMPSESQLAALGISADQARSYITAVQLAAKQKAANNNNGGSDDPKMTLTTAKEMAEAGYFTPEVVEALKNVGYSEQYLADVYGYEAPKTVDTAQGYKDLLNELSKIEDSGRNVVQNAVKAIEKAYTAGKITDDMAAKMLAQYGLK
jgi:hypothetical protein